MPEPSSSPHSASGLPPVSDRTPEARERVQGHLRASYGVRTAVEELLLERVVDLTWRLRGVGLALDAEARLGRLRAETQALTLRSPGRTWDVSVLDSRDPDDIVRGLSWIDNLAEELKHRSRLLTVQDLRRLLDSLIGTQRLTYGLDGCGPLRDLCLWHSWEECLAEDEEEVEQGAEPLPPDEDAPEPPPYTWAEELGKLQDRFVVRLAEAHEVQIALRAAHTDAGGRPGDDDLKALPRYERELAEQLEQATRALREAVGRRRLGEVGRAWLRGR